MANLMKGKRGLVMGVANDRSIAWGIASALAAEGAELAFSYQGDAFGKLVQPLAATVGSDFLIDVDVTKLTHPGRNLIAVRVMRSKDNNLDKDNDAVDAFYNQAQGNAVRGGTEKKQEKAKPTNILVDMPHGFYCGDPAGIWQPVKLVITNPVKVEDVFIKSNLHGADFDLTLKNHAAKAGTLQVRTRITDKATGELLYEGTSLPRVQLKGGQEQTRTYSIANLQPKLWSPDHPNLYNFQFTVTDARSHVIDTKTITSGFRTFQAKDGYLWLNGVKYWLRGGNHVPSAICPNDSVLAHKFFRLLAHRLFSPEEEHRKPAKFYDTNLSLEVLK